MNVNVCMSAYLSVHPSKSCHHLLRHHFCAWILLLWMKLSLSLPDPSQCSDKQENMLNGADPSKKQLETMRMELEKLKSELAEKNEQLTMKDNLLNDIKRQLKESQKQVEERDRLLREVRDELVNTTKKLDPKKDSWILWANKKWAGFTGKEDAGQKQANVIWWYRSRNIL